MFTNWAPIWVQTNSVYFSVRSFRQSLSVDIHGHIEASAIVVHLVIVDAEV